MPPSLWPYFEYPVATCGQWLHIGQGKWRPVLPCSLGGGSWHSCELLPQPWPCAGISAPLCILNTWELQALGQPGKGWSSASFQGRQLVPLVSDTWLPDIYPAASAPPCKAGEDRPGFLQAVKGSAEGLHSWGMSLTLG